MPGVPLKGKTILVVDDDPLYVELVKDVLESHQHLVAVAFNGAEALSLAEAQQFDLVVSDIEMPVMNGIRFHEEITKSDRLKHLPFIFLTGTENQEHLQYVREHPPAVLLRKSNMVEELLSLV